MASKKKSISFKVGIMVFSTILFVVFSFYAYQILFTSNFQIKKNDKSLVFYINKNMDFKAVVDSLKKGEILHDEISFRFLSKLMGYPEKIIPGAYLIERDDNNFNVLKRLTKGRQSPSKLTFNNVRLKSDLAEKISTRLNINKDSLVEALNSPEVCQKYGFDTTTIMCMFIPNTYEMYWDLSIEKLMDRMFKEYDKFWTVARQEKAKKAGLSQNQVQILASIVEAETQQNAEKARIAGVYLNRFRKGQKLQADPTVKFALKQFELKRIYFSHLNTESPYNTYKYKGLPPGPINLPSVKSIEAVLNAENHNYYFFCADMSNPGFHKFAENFLDHVSIANEYRRKVDSLNIK